MTGSKQFSIMLCALAVVTLLGGYFYFALRGPVTTTPAFKPVFPDDPQMQAAYDKAHEGLDYFLELAAEPPPETQGFAIKARILEKDRQEIFWIYPFANEGDNFGGRINDEPQTLLRILKGDFVEFDRRDIVDWTFDDTRLDIMHGNFTGCVELARKAPDNAEQFQELFGLNCTQ